MKANELRIGNWISDQGYETTVFQIDETHVNDNLMFDHFKPIKLNTEWIEGFGFEMECNEYFIWLIKGIPGFRVLWDHAFDIWQVGFVRQRVLRNIKYVHELQNVCYSLTGEELKLKKEIQ